MPNSVAQAVKNLALLGNKASGAEGLAAASLPPN